MPSAKQRSSDRAAPACAIDNAARLAAALKAVAHPVRLEILRQLAARDRCCCNDFCACLPLAQSTVSEHLDVLRRAGLVDFAPDGNRSRYSLNRKACAAMARDLSLTGIFGMEA
jgi:DNA-binding transcriptional ArsR family regulator